MPCGDGAAPSREEPRRSANVGFGSDEETSGSRFGEDDNWQHVSVSFPKPGLWE